MLTTRNKSNFEERRGRRLLFNGSLNTLRFFTHSAVCNKKMGNIAILVKEGKEIGQSLWIKIDNDKINLRIGVKFAKQKSRTNISADLTIS